MYSFAYMSPPYSLYPGNFQMSKNLIKSAYCPCKLPKTLQGGLTSTLSGCAAMITYASEINSKI